MASPADDHLPTVLAHAGTRLTVPAGWALACEGDLGTTAYVVVEGTLAVTRGGEEVARIGPGELAGELALLRGERRNATLIAVTPAVVIAMDAERFAAQRQRVPALARHLERDDAVR